MQRLEAAATARWLQALRNSKQALVRPPTPLLLPRQCLLLRGLLLAPPLPLSPGRRSLLLHRTLLLLLRLLRDKLLARHSPLLLLLSRRLALAQLPALLAQHFLLPAGERWGGCSLLGEPPAEPLAIPQRAQHTQVKPLQLPIAEQAGRGAGQCTVCRAPPHCHDASQLSPHPGHLLVRRHAGLAGLAHIRLEQPAGTTRAGRGERGVEAADDQGQEEQSAGSAAWKQSCKSCRKAGTGMRHVWRMALPTCARRSSGAFRGPRVQHLHLTPSSAPPATPPAGAGQGRGGKAGGREENGWQAVAAAAGGGDDGSIDGPAAASQWTEDCCIDF